MNETNWYTESGCSLDEFASLLERDTARKPAFASDIQRTIPLYDCGALADVLTRSIAGHGVAGGMGAVFHDGAGVLVLKHAYADTGPVDDATAVFESIIREERSKA